MIPLDFRTKGNGVPILSKDTIEHFAEIIMQDYKAKRLEVPGY